MYIEVWGDSYTIYMHTLLGLQRRVLRMTTQFNQNIYVDLLFKTKR